MQVKRFSKISIITLVFIFILLLGTFAIMPSLSKPNNFAYAAVPANNFIYRSNGALPSNGNGTANQPDWNDRRYIGNDGISRYTIVYSPAGSGINNIQEASGTYLSTATAEVPANTRHIVVDLGRVRTVRGVMARQNGGTAVADVNGRISAVRIWTTPESETRNPSGSGGIGNNFGTFNTTASAATFTTASGNLTFNRQTPQTNPTWSTAADAWNHTSFAPVRTRYVAVQATTVANNVRLRLHELMILSDGEIGDEATFAGLAGVGDFYLSPNATVTGLIASVNRPAFTGTLHGNNNTLTIDVAGRENSGRTPAVVVYNNGDGDDGRYGFVAAELGTGGTIRDMTINYNRQWRLTVGGNNRSSFSFGIVAGRINGGTIDNVTINMNESLGAFHRTSAGNGGMLLGAFAGRSDNGTISNSRLNIGATFTINGGGLLRANENVIHNWGRTRVGGFLGEARANTQIIDSHLQSANNSAILANGAVAGTITSRNVVAGGIVGAVMGHASGTGAQGALTIDGFIYDFRGVVAVSHRNAFTGIAANDRPAGLIVGHVENGQTPTSWNATLTLRNFYRRSTNTTGNEFNPRTAVGWTGSNTTAPAEGNQPYNESWSAGVEGYIPRFPVSFASTRNMVAAWADGTGTSRVLTGSGVTATFATGNNVSHTFAATGVFDDVTANVPSIIPELTRINNSRVYIRYHFIPAASGAAGTLQQNMVFYDVGGTQAASRINVLDELSQDVFRLREPPRLRLYPQ